jgi:hypothetical protein
MYIPKYRVVDVVELTKELDNYHTEADENGNDDLVDEVYWHVFDGVYGQNFGYAEDHIRHPEDDDWDTIPESIQQAYDYLITMYGFQRGDRFLWYFSE